MPASPHLHDHATLSQHQHLPHPTIAIATPLADTHVDIIRSQFPSLTIDYRPHLLPPQRWVADHVGDPEFVRSAEHEVEFHDMLRNANILYGIPGESPAMLSSTVHTSRCLQWVQGMAAGTGAQVREANLSDDELQRIVFTTSAGVHAGPLAEYALFGILCGAKTLPRLSAQKEAKEWSGRWPMGQIAEQTIAIIGLGKIGQEVAKKASLLGARVIAVNQSIDRHENVSAVFPPEQLHAALSQADAIVLTLPDSPSTRNLLDRRAFAACRPGTTIVNVGRGTVIDEAALIDSLNQGQVGLAVLDVFAEEPLTTQSPLWGHPNVIISPHTAGLNAAEDRLIMELFCENLDRYLSGKELINRVDPERL